MGAWAGRTTGAVLVDDLFLKTSTKKKQTL
jgi:hypothetical protein